MGFWDRVMGRPTSTAYTEVAARLTADDGGVVVFWRPGCTFCQRLALTLRSVSHDATWVDIWSDDDARAYVRSVNHGDETVPTVVIDGRVHTNPAPSVVRAALAA